MAICRRVANQLNGPLSAKGSENVDLVLDKFCTNMFVWFCKKVPDLRNPLDRTRAKKAIVSLISLCFTAKITCFSTVKNDNSKFQRSRQTNTIKCCINMFCLFSF